jgi:hypothetical protein
VYYTTGTTKPKGTLIIQLNLRSHQNHTHHTEVTEK